MKYSMAAIAALSTTNAFAHSGHVARIDGHTHTLAELAMMGVVPVLAGVAFLAVCLIAAKRRNG